jgi:hypothetical protein
MNDINKLKILANKMLAENPSDCACISKAESDMISLAPGLILSVLDKLESKIRLLESENSNLVDSMAIPL